MVYTPHLEAESGKFALVLSAGDSVPHASGHSTYTELGVYTPHLNYISGKAAVIVTTGDATISEGSYVLSYPLGVQTPEVFNPWGIDPRPDHIHIVYIEGSASLSGFSHTNGDPLCTELFSQKHQDNHIIWRNNQ